MMNIVLTILAIVMIAGAVFLCVKAIHAIRSWDDDTTIGKRLIAVILIIVSAGLLIGAIVIGCHSIPGIVSGASGSKAVETPAPTATPAPSESAQPTEDKGGASWLNKLGLGGGILLIILGVIWLIAIIRKWRNRGGLGNTLRVLLLIVLVAIGGWLIYSNASALAGPGKKSESPSTPEPTATASGSAADFDADDLDNGKLPPGAFAAADFSEEDLLKAMQQKFGEDFTWDEYQNSFSDDLFPSKYNERKGRAKAAMRKWYGDNKKQGFSDPVWFPMDDLIAIYHTDKWKKMSADEKLKFVDEKIRLVQYDQILRNPRFCEMYVEFFYELAKEFPEIISRNEAWLPDFKAEFDQANDVSNKVQNAEGNEIVAGISVFFEPVGSADAAKVLRKEYVMNAARICLMFDEFTPALNTVQSPKSKINWHLAFGKDAQTAKVSKLAKKKDQEEEPAVIWLYRYKPRTAIKAGSDVFDQRLEIFPLTKKAKKEPPIKEPVPKVTPGPRSNPDPGNNPNPGKKTPPKATPKPGKKTPKVTPEPNKPKVTPKPNTPKPGTPTPKPDKPKKPDRRPTGDGPTNNNTTAQPTKPPKVDHKPVPAQPTKKPDTKPTQKPNAPAGNGDSSGSGKKEPVPVHKDTNATVTDPNGGSTTTNTSDGKPNTKVPPPSD